MLARCKSCKWSTQRPVLVFLVVILLSHILKLVIKCLFGQTLVKTTYLLSNSFFMPFSDRKLSVKVRKNNNQASCECALSVSIWKCSDHV